MPLPAWVLALSAIPALGALFEKQGPDIQTIPALSPEQQALARQLAGLIGGQLGQGVAPYTGQLSAGVPGGLRTAMASVADLVGSLPSLGAMPAMQRSPFTGTVQSALERVLSGAPVYQVDTAATQRAIEAAQAPAVRQFREEILPSIREQYVGGGAFWSRARQEAESRAAANLAENLAAQRAQGALQDIEAQRQAALTGAQLAAQALPTATSYALQSAWQPFEAAMTARQQAWQELLGGRQAQLQAAQALAGMAGQQYQMEQDALTRAYQEWLRTRPEASPYLQMALDFLGIPMVAAYQPPYRPSPWAALLQAAATLGAGALQGGYFG